MSEQAKWEYRIRVVTDGMLGDVHALGKRDIEDVSLIEKELNKLADDGWELTPTIVQTKMGRVALILRRPKAEQGKAYY